jgi:hypothetical protein
MPVTDEIVAPLRALLTRQYVEYDRLFGLLDPKAKNPGYRVLVSAAFVVAVERRFSPDVSQEEVIEFVADARSRPTDPASTSGPCAPHAAMRPYQMITTFR